MEQLLDVTAKFNGHYMTKMLKQVKAEKDALEKTKTEQTQSIKMLVDELTLKRKDLEKAMEDFDMQQRQNKLQ